MASSLQTKLRIGASILFASGFWDAVAGRFAFQADAPPAPPSADRLDWTYADLRGVLHVHSTYSDGAGDIPTILEAAGRAGVDFVLLCDHNTQRPLRDGWESRSAGRPLLLIGTEVTVEHGAFLLALDMPPEWEPTIGQSPQTAIDEVRSHGGLPIVSLPFDVKHPWRDWDAHGFEGLEVLNLSTIARRHINFLSLLWLLPIYQFKGARAVLRALVTRPDQALARWDRITRGGTRQSVGIGALDAHALMKIGSKKYPIPSYEDSFHAAATHVLIPRGTPTGDLRRAIYDALRAGHCYFSYDCLRPVADIRFGARTSHSPSPIIMGDRVARPVGGSVVLTAQAETPVLLRLYRDGAIVAGGSAGNLTFDAREPGAYRLEGSLYAFRIGPWYVGVRPYFFTNPIYVT